MAFLSFPPYQYLPGTHYIRRNISFPDSLRPPPPTPDKLYGDFGFSPISSVPAPSCPSPRTEEYLFSRFSPYSTTYSRQVVRRFWLFSYFLRTIDSLTPTTYGGIPLFLILSVLHYLHQTSCTEILAFLAFPPYHRLPNTHHVRRNISFPDSLRTPLPTPNKLYGDFGFSLISSVPTPSWHPPRTEITGYRLGLLFD